jgi:LPXTG-motif cell wall-anchored protein
MSSLFPGGQTTPGATGGMSMTIPLIIGAAAVIGFLMFKKK